MKINKIIIYITVFLLLFSESVEKVTYLKLSFVDEFFTIMLLIIAILEIFARNNINANSFKLFCGLIAFFLVGIFSCLVNSDFILTNVIISGFLTVKFFIIIISVMNIDINLKIKHLFIKALIFWGYVVLFFGVINFIFPEEFMQTFKLANIFYRNGFVSVSSLFIHPGKYGWFMLFISLFYFSKINIYFNKKDFFKMIIFLIGAFLSLRAKVFISFFLVFICSYVVTKKRKIDFKEVFFGTTASLVTLYFSGNILITNYKLYFTNVFGLSARQSLNLNSFKIMIDYFPIGVGFGKFGSWFARINYSDYYYKYNMSNIFGLRPSNSIYAVDTFWPMIIGETGIIGTAIFILMIMYIVNKLYWKYKYDSFDYYNLFLIFISIQTICESFGEPSFSSPPQSIIVSLLIGFYIKGNLKRKEKYKFI